MMAWRPTIRLRRWTGCDDFDATYEGRSVEIIWGRLMVEIAFARRPRGAAPGAPRACDWCGCTENRACTGADGLACYWTAPGLCSTCAETQIEVMS
jgi:hypothetical protein